MKGGDRLFDFDIGVGYKGRGWFSREVDPIRYCAYVHALNLGSQ